MNNKLKEDLEKLKEAIYNTASIHSIEQARGALEKLILNNNMDSFTRNNSARQNLIDSGSENIKKAAIKRYVDLVIRDPNESKNPLEEAMKRTYRKYKDNPRIYALGTIELLLNKCLTEEKNFFIIDENGRDDLNNYSTNNNLKLSEFVGNSIAKKITEHMLLEKQEEINNDIPTISNIQTYPANIEQLKSSIISGTRIKREGTISLGRDLQACSSIGKIRKNQEDAVLLIRHPLNPEFKMMVVADGLGSLDAGAKASDMVVSEIQSWFETLDVSYFESLEGIGENLEQALNIISKRINVELSGRGASTFVGAIIGKGETVISNVGDSRAYMVSGTSLQEITEEPSLARDLSKQGVIKSPADAILYKDENKVTQALGKESIKPNFYYLSNFYYDAIMLFSDGVTDCLSDEELYAITRSTDRSKLAEAIVKSALKPKITEKGNIERQINAGRDDTTAAVYLNEGLKLESELIRVELKPKPPTRKRTLVIDGRVVVVEENAEGEDKVPEVEVPEILFD